MGTTKLNKGGSAVDGLSDTALMDELFTRRLSKEAIIALVERLLMLEHRDLVVSLLGSERLSAKEASKLLNLSPVSVRKYCQQGVLQGVKKGRDWFVSREEIERYNRERRSPGKAPSS